MRLWVYEFYFFLNEDRLLSRGFDAVSNRVTALYDVMQSLIKISNNSIVTSDDKLSSKLYFKKVLKFLKINIIICVPHVPDQWRPGRGGKGAVAPGRQAFGAPSGAPKCWRLELTWQIIKKIFLQYANCLGRRQAPQTAASMLAFNF